MFRSENHLEKPDDYKLNFIKAKMIFIISFMLGILHPIPIPLGFINPFIHSFIVCLVLSLKWCPFKHLKRIECFVHSENSLYLTEIQAS